jgi:uncharacterized protein
MMTMFKTIRANAIRPLLAGVAMAGLLAGTALAIDNGGPIDKAMEAGRVGEQADGYLGFVSAPTTAESDLVRRISDVNARRRTVYTETAARIGDTVERVALFQAMRQVQNAPLGEFFRDLSGSWCRKTTASVANQAADGTVVIRCR